MKQLKEIKTDAVTSQLAKYLGLELTHYQQLQIVRDLVGKDGFESWFCSLCGYGLTQQAAFELTTLLYMLIVNDLAPYSSFESFISSRNRKIRTSLKK